MYIPIWLVSDRGIQYISGSGKTTRSGDSSSISFGLDPIVIKHWSITKTKRRRSDPVLWQKPLHQRSNTTFTTFTTFGKFFRSYSDLLSKFGEISFQEYVTEGISHPVFYGDLVYKLRRVRCEANFVSSGSKIVKRLRRRKYDPLIIENTIGLVLGPSTALYRSFLEHCTLTNKAEGTIWRDLSKPPQRRQGPDPRPLWLLVGTPLVLGPELASRRAEHSHSGGCHYIFWIYCFYHLTCVIIFMASPLQLAVGPRPSQGGLFTNF